jgi:hypothetical protein
MPLDLRLSEDAVERYLNDLNKELLDVVQRGGEAFVSNAVVRGRYLLRACIVNFHTSDSDVEALPDIVVQQARVLDDRNRPDGLRGESARSQER